MTLAVMVLGAESSGNRLMTRLLIAAGCDGDGDVFQRLDAGIPPAGTQPIVWLRSVPHNNEFPALGACFRLLRTQGYRVKAVVMLRDWQPMTRSQVETGHTPSPELAEERTRQAYPHIFNALLAADVPYVTVTLEGLIARPESVLRWLTNWLGLPMPDTHETIRDVDEKWWV